MPTPAIIVWSKPACVQCDATKRALTKHGLPYIERDLTQHLGQLEEFKKAGYVTAPIVQTSTETWAGFQPDRIKALRDD